MTLNLRKKLPQAVVSLSLAATGLTLASALPAYAATGGAETKNPGIVSLIDDQGKHQCSAVLVSPEWALTWSDTARCGGNDTVSDGAGHYSTVTERRYFQASDGLTPNDPSKSQAMLVHLARPLPATQPAKLSTHAPAEGEKLDLVAFNGVGENHTSSVGRGSVTIEGHNAWLSWFGAPADLQLEHSDAGAALVRGDDEVVGFVGLAEPTGGDAEDIANVMDWIQDVTK